MPLSARLLLAASLLAPVGAHAAEFWMVAKPTTLVAEDTEIPMWGFALASREQFGRMLAGQPVDLTATVPGPALKVPAGDGTVTIHLLNQLPRPVSLTLRGRDHGKPVEAPPVGGLQTYRWTDVTPGSFLYESGSDPAFQVPMGLYGPLVAEGDGGPVPHGRQYAIVFGELDPAFHRQAAGPTASANALNYKAALQFAEPMALDGPRLTTKDLPTRQGEPVLLRFYNAGMSPHAPVVSGNLLAQLAADGNPLPFPATQSSVPLPPGGTRDVLLFPSQPGRYGLLDQGIASGTHVMVEPSAAPQALDDAWPVEGTLKAEKGVLANDSHAEGAHGGLTAVLVSPPAHARVFALNPDGSFTYTAQPGYSGPDGFHYVAVQGDRTSAPARVTLQVAPPPPAKVVAAAAKPATPKPKPAADLKSPIADDHTYTLSRKQAQTGAALNVLAHAKTPNPGARLDPATIMVTKPAKGGTLSVDRKTGTITYKAPAGLVGSNTFLYAVKDSAGKTSNAATITVTVAP